MSAAVATLPTAQGGVPNMLRTPAERITAMIVGGVVLLGLLGIVGWLLYSGRDTAAILTLVNGLVTAAIYAKLRDVDSKATRVEQHVNGNTTRLMNHALRPPVDPTEIDPTS